MQSLIWSTARLSARSDEATLCVEKNATTWSRESALQKLPVAETTALALHLVSCAVTLSQFC